MSGTWTFEEHGQWNRFDPAGEQAVEAAFLTGQPTAQSAFYNPRLKQTVVYSYDLSAMKQINTTTGWQRNIKRVAPGAVAQAPQAQGHAYPPAKRLRAPASPVETIQYKAPDDPAGGAAAQRGFSDEFAIVTQFDHIKVKDLGEGDVCSICMCDFQDNAPPNERCIRLSKCKEHYFHRECVDNPLCFKQSFLKCPVCKTSYGVEVGPQPSGTMTIQSTSHMCDGYDTTSTGTWQIDYSMPGGVQTSNMPSPGVPYSGTTRNAYLPINQEGNEVLALLKIAFSRGLTFAVGQSVTSGVQNTTVWNGIHHKTNTTGGSSRFGYPDEGYFGRVKDELALKGIEPNEDLDLDRFPF